MGSLGGYRYPRLPSPKPIAKSVNKDLTAKREKVRVYRMNVQRQVEEAYEVSRRFRDQASKALGSRIQQGAKKSFFDSLNEQSHPRSTKNKKRMARTDSSLETIIQNASESKPTERSQRMES